MDLATLRRESKDSIDALVAKAFEVGRELGHKQAMAEIKSRMSLMFDEPKVVANESAQSPKTDDAPHSSLGQTRATPGSIRPKIEAMLREAPNGLSKSEIVQRTGFKDNTVRGTLWTLGQAGIAGHENGRWFIQPQKANAPSDQEDAFA